MLSIKMYLKYEAIPKFTKYLSLVGPIRKDFAILLSKKQTLEQLRIIGATVIGIT